MSPVDRRAFLRNALLGGLGLTALGRYPMAGIASARPLLNPSTRPDPSKPEGEDLLPQIEHIVVLMMENHSFDNYFGTLGRGDGFTIGGDGLPDHWNPVGDGTLRRAYAAGTPDQTGFDTGLGWNNVRRQIHGGAMDGFVQHSGNESMAYFTEAEIPFYRSLAGIYPVCDRYFCSVPGATYPNRRFLTAGTAAGLTRTEVNDVIDNPSAPNGTIYERLDAFGISWKNFSAGLPEVALWPDYFLSHQETVRPVHEFYVACRTNTLPSVSWVTPGLNRDEHPPQDISDGEQYSGGVIRELMASDAWAKTVLIYTYDEHGGFYDHVPPPPAIPPGDGIAPIPSSGPLDADAQDYDRYGVRVPALVISPFSRANKVSSVVHDHTSILRLIETKWNLGALTQRDANASNLLDSLDLSASPTFAEPPELAPPRRGWPDIDAVIAEGEAATTTTTAPAGPGMDDLITHPEAQAQAAAAQPIPGSSTYTG